MGDPPEFDEWVAARGRSLLRLAYVLTGNATDAEDVVQDALSRALPRWSRIATVEDPDAYLRRMVINAHTSSWRKFRRRESPVSEVLGTSVEAVLPDDALWQACRRLPEPLRTSVVLRYYEDLDYAAIAELTGVREGSVRSRVSRGIALLRTELGDEHE
ncbi:SigE family RNA polymerase sigma factor [Nocardioides sp.]|uniref:SigE family RNA polymerase sigma factor n=1 Tax=Nocardioides sp. TaxID=35761 RepID=UPI003D0ABB2F